MVVVNFVWDLIVISILCHILVNCLVAWIQPYWTNFIFTYYFPEMTDFTRVYYFGSCKL